MRKKRMTKSSACWKTTILGGAHDIGDVPSVLVERPQHYFLTYKLIPGKPPAATVGKIYGREHVFAVVRAAMADYIDKFVRSAE